MNRHLNMGPQQLNWRPSFLLSYTKSMSNEHIYKTGSAIYLLSTCKQTPDKPWMNECNTNNQLNFNKPFGRMFVPATSHMLSCLNWMEVWTTKTHYLIFAFLYMGKQCSGRASKQSSQGRPHGVGRVYDLCWTWFLCQLHQRSPRLSLVLRAARMQ